MPDAFWSDEDDAYIAVTPEFPTLSGIGDTQEEALEELGIVVEVAREIANEDR